MRGRALHCAHAGARDGFRHTANVAQNIRSDINYIKLGRAAQIKLVQGGSMLLLACWAGAARAMIFTPSNPGNSML